jgi:outer membrane protein assembly factor BamB
MYPEAISCGSSASPPSARRRSTAAWMSLAWPAVRIWRPALTACSLALALAACGGGGTTKRTETHATSATPPPAKASAGWPTYHRDLARGGFDATAPRLGALRRSWSAGLDGKVYAEPLVAGGLVVAATENDSVYGLEAGSGRVRWRTHLGTPVDGGDLPCGNIDPSGITGTPAIDARAGVVYVVGFLAPAHHVLAALRLGDGGRLWTRDIDPPGADPEVHQQRAALAVSGGRVYVAYGGLFGDCGDYHGWVLGAPAAGPSGSLGTYRVPTNREGGIWAPSGPAIDARGDLFVSTGNGESTSSFDYGNAVIRLSPDLRPADYFAPRDFAALNAADLDLASVGPLPLPGGRLFAIGKSGVGYLLDTNRLGGIGGSVASRQVCSSAFGGAAYAHSLLYIPCTDGIVALRPASRSFAVAWRGPGFRAGPPIVAGDLVWTVDLDGGRLVGLDARSGRSRASADIGDPPQFSTPSASGGSLYVSGGSSVLGFTAAAAG